MAGAVHAVAAVLLIVIAHRVASRACDPNRYEPSIASALLAAPRNGSAAAEAFMSGCSRKPRLWTAYDTKKYVQNNWHAGEPTGASCGHLQRIGLYGDGGKMLCDTAQLLPIKQPCRVISVGSNGEFSFERGIRDIAPHCSIDVFDGTLINERAALAAKLPSYVKFVAKNVDSSTWRQYQGDTSIRILKMDCEGCELRALLPFVENVCVEQLLLETHLCLRPSDVDRRRRSICVVFERNVCLPAHWSVDWARVQAERPTSGLEKPGSAPEACPEAAQPRSRTA